MPRPDMIEVTALVDLDTTVKHLEQELKAMKAERAQQADKVRDIFERDGVQSIRTDSGLAFLERKIHASSPVEFVQQLKNHPDTFELIQERMNQNTLGAWVRELPRDDDDMPIIPDDLKHCINVVEEFKVKVRKS